MRVLVTGGTGAVGGYVTRLLAALGHLPIVYGRSNRPIAGLDRGAYRFVAGRIEDADRVDAVARESGAQRLIHLAAVLDDGQDDPVRATRVNIDGTVNALEAARRAGMDRFVFTSSKRALGPIDGPYGYPTYRPVNEDHPARPVFMYDITKFAAEIIGANFEAIHGLPVVTVRFAQTYGPGKASRADAGMASVRSKMVENAMLGRPVRIPKGGDGRDDCVYVKDVAQGIVKACVVETPRHRLFHLGTGIGESLHDFADAVRAVLPGADIEIGPGPSYREDVGYPFECVFDISRAVTELGYAPEYDLRRGVADYVEAVRSGVDGPTYVR